MTDLEREKIEILIEVMEELLFACKSMHGRLHGEPDITGECRFADAIARAETIKGA